MKNLKQVPEETKQAIRFYLSESLRLKNAYFWNSPSSAHSRRGYETKNSFSYVGDEIELEIKVSCSCKNIYVYRTVIIEGKKTTATALKKFIK